MDSTQRVRSILSFIQVADGGSFVAAARVLGISAAAVSKNVSGLEKALGVRLMNRTTRTLSLTVEGHTFLAQARIGVDALSAAVDAVSAHGVEPSGCVRIATSGSFGREQLMPVIPELLARHPALTIDIDFDDRRIDFINEGYDLALRGGTIANSSLISRPVCRLNMVLVAAPSYLQRHGIPGAPEQLTRHKLISRRFLSGAISKWAFTLPDGDITTFEPPQPVLIVSAPEALVQAALAGAGIAQAAVHHAWPHLQSGRLNVILPEHHHPGGYEMVLQYPHRALLASRVRVVIEHLLSAFAQDPLLHVPLADLRQYAARRRD
jgi:DNA-binding transcriptional LysR family regulator